MLIPKHNNNNNIPSALTPPPFQKKNEKKNGRINNGKRWNWKWRRFDDNFHEHNNANDVTLSHDFGKICWYYKFWHFGEAIPQIRYELRLRIRFSVATTFFFLLFVWQPLFHIDYVPSVKADSSSNASHFVLRLFIVAKSLIETKFDFIIDK